MIQNVIIVSSLFTLRLRVSKGTYETVSIVLFVGIDKISPPIVMVVVMVMRMLVVVVVGRLVVVEIAALLLLLLPPHPAAQPA